MAKVRLGILIVIALSGCGGGKKTYVVEGVVEFEDGKPAVELAGGSIEFDLIGGKTTARGTIDSEGKYRMMTYQPGDGALPGKHRVLILPPVMTHDAKAPPADVMDRRYRTYQTSGLEVVVEEKPNFIPIKIDRAKKETKPAPAK